VIFLALAVALPQFAPFTAENNPGDAVSLFRAIELRQPAPSHIFVVDAAKRVPTRRSGLVAKCCFQNPGCEFGDARGWMLPEAQGLAPEQYEVIGEKVGAPRGQAAASGRFGTRCAGS
jgi:hypothetical protein